MSDFTYNDEFSVISGTIEGSNFEPHFDAIEIAINSKADIAGPVSHTGTHTFANCVATILSSPAATFTGTPDFTGATLVDCGPLQATTLAGAADTVDITGGTWS